MADLLDTLDDHAVHAARDPRGFRDLLRGFPEQLRAAEALAHGVRVDRPRAVVVFGMGGSAVAGDYLGALCRDRAPFPVEVVRGYAPPAWIGPNTLAVVSSYSGGTEETLTAFAAARARGASPLIVSSGGELGRLAVGAGLPWVRVPPGLPPRAALAHLLIPLVVLLEGTGVDLGGPAARAEAVAVLASLGRELDPSVPAAANMAKELAGWLAGRTPAVYGTDLTAPVAYRWATQFTENAKVLALSGVLPEMNHNAIEAWAAGAAGAWAVVLLRDGGEHPRVARRLDLTRPITEAAAPTREIRARGTGRLARLLSLTLLGDWTSYYLAVLRGVDPWAIDALEAFKRRLAET